MKKFLLLFLFPIAAFSQGVNVTSSVTTAASNVPVGAKAPLYTVPYSVITVCGYPATGAGSVCTNLASIYSNQALTVPIVGSVITADAQGRYSFWVAAGTYAYSIVTAQGSYVGTYAVSIGGTGGGGSGINQLTGDVTAGPGTGSQAATLATVNSNVGSCGDATHTSQITLDAKGRAVSCIPIAITSASGLTSVGLTMPAGIFSVTGSPLTSNGTIAVGLANQSAAQIFAGPTTGSGVPAFRGLIGTDLPPATNTTFGAVKPDNSTITISGGVISAPGGGGCALGTCVQNSASVDQNVVQAAGSALNVTHLGITDNELLNAKASNFISNGASEDTLVNGGEPEKLADLLQVPTGSRTINAISSASLVDMLTCSNASCSHTATNGQDGTLPVSFPLGVTSNTKSQLGFGFNDLSNMGGSPTAANLDYFHGQELAWGIMFATPDTLKLSTSASCTFTGTWVPVTGSIWPAGAMKATTDAATATCVLPPATDAGIISYKNTGSDGVWSATVTEAGVTHNVTDTYLNTTSIAQNSGTYISAWGGTYDLWAIGVSGLPGGTPTVVMTCTHAGSDGCLFVAPYAMAPSGTLQNSPALLIKLTLLQCNNGTCSGAISGHSDAQINLIRNEQLKAANELRANGLNVTPFDGDAAPQGMNPNNVADTGRVPIFTVSAGGTGYSNGNLTFSGGGCTVLPTAAAVPLSGGVLTAGTYFVISPGACTSAPTIAFSGGGSGAAGAATYVNDVHPNVVGAAKIAAAGFTSLNGALNASDKFSPRSTSNCDLATGANSEFCVSIPSNQMNMLGVYTGFAVGANSGTFAMNRIPSTGAIYDSTQGAFQLQHVVGSTTPANDTWAIESYPSTGGFVAAALPFGWNGAGQVTVGNPSFLLNFCGTAYFNIANCTWVWNNGGGMTSAGVTGGDMGAHTINVHAIYQDGVAVGSGGTGTVTHTAGALASNKLMLGNAAADSKTDTVAGTDGAGNMTAVSYATSGTTPGAVSLSAGTGTMGALPANSAGLAGPATGGTSYLIAPPATMTAGVAHFAAPATLNGVLQSALSSTLIGIADLSATGTPSSSTYLRGDNTWATIAGGGTLAGLAAGTAPSASGTYNFNDNAIKTTAQSGIDASTGSVTALLPANTLFYATNAATTASRFTSMSYGATSFFSAARVDGTPASPTTVLATEQIGGINAWAYDGTAMGGPLASMRLFANENQTASAHGAYMDWTTTTNGTTTAVSRMTLAADGGLFMTGATGGSQGAGSVNMASCFVNGVACGVAGATVWSTVSSGTNTNALVMGTGGTFDVSGTGINRATALKSATTNVDVSAATAPTSGQVLTATSGTAATWQTPSGGSSALSAITAATGSNTIASGNNAQTWNWALTTNGATAMTFGETTAATGTTNQLVGITTIAGSTAVPLTITQSLGSNQITHTVDINPTWNVTSAFAPTALNINVTDTSSAATARLLALQVGGTSMMTVDKKGLTKSAAFGSFGTKFTASGCSNSTTVGGASAGTFVIGATACTVVVTINGATGLAATNGWSCFANDRTTAAAAGLIQQTASTTTTASFSIPATAATSDVINFGCTAY